MCFVSGITHTAEAEYATAKTSVWWDIENCPVPKGWDAHTIAQKLNSALVNLNYRGPLSITAYGNTDLIPKAVQQALSATGISLNHVPSGKKDASDKKILVDMFLWVLENPAPANLMLISGDGDFSYALNRLRMLRYNILLAHPLQASPFLVASARTSWMWRSLIASGCGPSTTRSCCCCCSVGSETSSQDVPVPVSEQVFSTQEMESGSGTTSKAERKKLRRVLRELNQCNVACKSIEHSAQWELKQNLELLGEPENIAAGASSGCHEQVNEITNKALVVVAKNIVETVQEDDLKSRDAQESIIKCLEKEKKELMEAITASERSEKEFWEGFKERLDKSGVAPLSVEHVFSELSRDFDVPKEVRECFEAIFKKLEPTQNDIEIEKLESMLKQGFEIESGEPEYNAPAELTESLEGDMTKMKKKSTVIEDKYEPFVCGICNVICDHPSVFESHHKSWKHADKFNQHIDALLDRHQLQQEKIIQDNRLRKDMKVIDDKAEPYVCTICNVVCDHPSVFESHHKGRKHAAKVKKHTKALLDNHQKQEETIQDDGLPKDMIMIEEKYEPYLCSICNVVCDHPSVFESHHKGRKHAAKVKKHAESLLDDHQKQEEIIQDMTEELQMKPVEAPENIDYLDKQRQELGERCATTSERSVEDSFQTIEEVGEIDSKSLPNLECFFAELNAEFSAPQEASEWIDAIFKKPEVSEDANSTGEFESIPSQNLEMNSCDPESSSAGATEHPEEYIDMKKENVTEDNDVPKPYMCSICSVSCVSPIVFESHLLGRKHAAKVKNHAEYRFSLMIKKVLEQSLEEKDHPRDALEELQIEPKDAQVSIKEVTQISEARVDNNENEQIPEDKETSRERFDSIVKRLDLFMEKTSKQTLVESVNASERVGEEVVGKWKEIVAEATQVRVCDWCNVICQTQMDLDSHLAGRRHAVRTQTRVCDWCSVMCHSQTEFDLHLGGKRHVAALKKHVPLVKKEVAVV